MNSAIVNAITLCSLAIPAPCTIIEAPLAASPAVTLQTCGSSADPSDKVPSSTIPRNTSPAAVPRPVQNTAAAYERFLANNRVEVLIPESTAILGKKFKVHLHVESRNINKIYVRQLVWATQNSNPQLPSGSDSQAAVQFGEGKTAYIEITPLRLGEVEVRLTGIFGDGAMFSKRVKINVQEPAAQPASFTVGDAVAPDGSVRTIRMRLERPIGNTLIPSATYNGVPELLRIDPKFVRSSVRAQPGQSVIELDKATGNIKPLATGHAVIETSYGGRTARTCVIVVAREQDIIHDHSDCSDLAN